MLLRLISVTKFNSKNDMMPVMSGRPSSQPAFSTHVQNVLKTLRPDEKKTEIELNKIVAKAKERGDLYLSATVLAPSVLLVTATLYDFNVWILSIILFSLAAVIKFEDVTNYLIPGSANLTSDPPDAKIHDLENKCEEQKWEIEELKHKNKKLVNESKEKSIKIIKLEKGSQNTNARLDKSEIENKEKFEAISGKIHSKNNTENTEMIDKSNKDEIID